MIANRELGIDDYLEICRRRAMLVIVPALIAAALGLGISFLLTPKYISRSLLVVEGQTVPDGYVKPIITQRVSDRMLTLEQNVLSRDRLQALVTRLGLATKGESVSDVVEDIRNNVTVTQADPNAPPTNASGPSKSSSPPFSIRRRVAPGETNDVPGFYVNVTANNPRDAQQICGEITSMLLAENLELREQVAQSTTDFLSAQLVQAKHSLDELDGKISQFNKAYLGQLPSDTDKNLKILMELNSRLDSTTQTLSRAQQDKSFSESLLAQDLTTWKTSLASPNLPPLRQELINLQNQLVTLRARYTDDFPDVVKTKRDIAELQAKLKDLSPQATQDAALNKTSEAQSIAVATSAGVESVALKMDPPEILRLREQVHQSEVTIKRATQEQKRLQDLIASFQNKLAVSPEVAEQYRQLTRDYESARNIYDNLLANKNAAQIQTEMERKQQGEQITLLDAAGLPDFPSFPVRWMFAAGGLGAGLAFGIMAALWLELRDKNIRNEADVVAALGLPTLGSVPWLGEKAESKRIAVMSRRAASI